MADTSSPKPAADAAKTKITFRFCRECANLLYPREDKETNELSFACRTCYYTEKAETTCIFRNELANTVGETAGITQDIGEDPTVGDSSMPDFCTLCGQEIFCEFCGEETDRGFFLEVNEEEAKSGMMTPKADVESSQHRLQRLMLGDPSTGEQTKEKERT